jgi:hypothetical protein
MVNFNVRQCRLWVDALKGLKQSVIQIQVMAKWLRFQVRK